MAIRNSDDEEMKGYWKLHQQWCAGPGKFDWDALDRLASILVNKPPYIFGEFIMWLQDQEKFGNVKEETARDVLWKLSSEMRKIQTGSLKLHP